MKKRTSRKRTTIAKSMLGFYIALGFLIWHHHTYVPRTEHKEVITIVKAAEVARPLTVEERIRETARQEKFTDADFLVELARRESGLNPHRIQSGRNTPIFSADRGLFQFSNYWQKGVSDDCAMDVECSTRTTIKMIKVGKVHLWVAARSMRKPNL